MCNGRISEKCVGGKIHSNCFTRKHTGCFLVTHFRFSLENLSFLCHCVLCSSWVAFSLVCNMLALLFCSMASLSCSEKLDRPDPLCYGCLVVYMFDRIPVKLIQVYIRQVLFAFKLKLKINL